MNTKLVITALIALLGGGGQAFAQGPTLPKPDHVVIVIEENHGYNEIIGSASAPYINSLAQSGALFTQSFAIEHPSQPNYLDVFSGMDQGVHDDNATATFTDDNLGSELIQAGLTFDGYAESLPSIGSTVLTAYPYARKHVPWSDFSNVPGTDSLPFTSFPTDFTTLPTVSIVVPNLLDDMHDGTVAQGDTWLQQNLDSYVQWAKTHNSLLIVTWDEDDYTGTNQIATFFVGPMVKPGQYSETINHYTVLRTVEDIYGLAHAGSAQTATPVTDVWKQFHTRLLWNKTDGAASLWSVNPDTTYASVQYGPFPGWTAKAVAAAPDGSTNLLWTNTNGQASLWNVTALTPGGYTATQYGPYPGYTAVSLSTGSDGNPRLLWDKTDGTANLWTVHPANGTFSYTTYGPYAGWTAKSVASGNTVTDLLWTKTDGTASGFRIAADNSLTYQMFGPYNGYAATSVSVGPDDGAHLLWDKSDGTALLWNVDFTSGAFTYKPYGPFSGWSAKAIATGPDNVTHLLWDNTDGTASLWNVTGSGYTDNAYGPFSGWTAVGVSAGL